MEKKKIWFPWPEFPDRGSNPGLAGSLSEKEMKAADVNHYTIKDLLHRDAKLPYIAYYCAVGHDFLFFAPEVNLLAFIY